MRHPATIALIKRTIWENGKWAKSFSNIPALQIDAEAMRAENDKLRAELSDIEALENRQPAITPNFDEVVAAVSGLTEQMGDVL